MKNFLCSLFLLSLSMVFVPGSLIAQSAYFGGPGDGHAMAEIQDASLSTPNPYHTQQAIRLFPNPVSQDALTVEFEKLQSRIRYRLIDLMGQTASKGVSNNKQTLHISMSGIASGTYSLIIQTGAEHYRRKIVKLD